MNPWGHRPWCTDEAPRHQLIGDTPVELNPNPRQNPVLPEPMPTETESIIHLLLDLPLGVHVGVDLKSNEVVIRVPADVLQRRLRALVFA